MATQSTEFAIKSNRLGELIVQAYNEGRFNIHTMRLGVRMKWIAKTDYDKAVGAEYPADKPVEATQEEAK